MLKRGLFLILITLVTFLLSSIMVFSEEPAVLEPGFGDVSSQIAEALRQQQINELYQAFDSRNAATAVQILAANPDFWQLNGVSEAFANAIAEKPIETAEALNSEGGTALLTKNKEVQSAYAEEASKDVEVLNVAPKAKAALFKEKHGVAMENIEVQVTDYDDLTGQIETEVLETGVLEIKAVPAGRNYFSTSSLSRVTADNEKYGSGIITIDANGAIVFEPSQELKELDVPETDTITIAIPKGESLTYIADKDSQITGESGKPVYFNTHRIQGKVHVDQGQVKVWDEPAVINDVKIVPDTEIVDVYFDGQEHKGTYVSMNNQEKVMKFGRDIYEKEGFKVEFKPGNPYLENGYATMGPLYSDTDVTVANRGEELLPLVSIEQKGEFTAGMDLVNGYQRFGAGIGREEIKPGVIIPKGFFRFKGEGVAPELIGLESAPFTVMLFKDGKNVLGADKEKQKVVFDTDQNFVYVREDAEEKYERRGTRAIYDHLQGSIERTIGHRISAKKELNHISASLLNMPPEVREGIRDIDILPLEQLKKKCVSEIAVGCADPVTGDINLKEGTTYGTIYHEAVHTKASFEKTVLPTFKDFITYSLQLQKKYGDDFVRKSTTEEFEKYKELGNKHEAERSSIDSPKARWEGIAGGVYYEDLGGEQAAIRKEQWPEDGYAPRYGCVWEYACNSYGEDRAEFAAYVATYNPDFFVPLMAPPGHPKHDPQKYDPRYKEKLDLSFILGDISKENYEEIITVLQESEKPAPAAQPK